MTLKRVLLGLILAIAACGDATNNGNGDGGGGPPGGGNGMFPPGGTSFPWAVFDGTVPDTPESTTGNTWYGDPVNGNDSNDGSSIDKAKKTIDALLKNPALKSGDTILLAGGVYREYANFNAPPPGKPGAPTVIGSYGRGTGAPIIDGGMKPNAWTKYTAQGQTTVWQSSTAGLAKITSTTPVDGIYVGKGTSEYALREVPRGQISKYEMDPLPANQTQADIKDKSNNWYYDTSAKIVYADFGGTLGTDDPNGADISLLFASYNGPSGHEPLIVLIKGQDYFSFIGLTLRAGSWNSVYAESSGLTFDHCDVKFNGGGGIFFGVSGADSSVTGNTVTYTRIWMNVLENWPRFNNGYTSGGWPGALSWFGQSNVLAQGNVIYQNGGEGLILWGTPESGHVSTNQHVLHNIIFDNFSVNLYLDNTQGATIEQNFVFDHPRDDTQTFDGLFTLSSGYNGDFGKRITPANISLADEPFSAFDSEGHLSDITVINNIFAGGKFGFVDYDDGTKVVFHGLKSCVIANNTWILGDKKIPGQSSYVWRHLSPGANPDNSSNSILQNNIFLTTATDDHFVEAGESGAGPGINNDYNLYTGPGQWTVMGDAMDFAAWKSAHSSWDQHSLTGDAMLADVNEFTQTSTQKLVYDWSKAMPGAGSPALGAGTGQQFNTDFTGATRSGNDLGALVRH